MRVTRAYIPAKAKTSPESTPNNFGCGKKKKKKKKKTGGGGSRELDAWLCIKSRAWGIYECL